MRILVLVAGRLGNSNEVGIFDVVTLNTDEFNPYEVIHVDSGYWALSGSRQARPDTVLTVTPDRSDIFWARNAGRKSSELRDQVCARQCALCVSEDNGSNATPMAPTCAKSSEREGQRSSAQVAQNCVHCTGYPPISPRTRTSKRSYRRPSAQMGTP